MYILFILLGIINSINEISINVFFNGTKTERKKSRSGLGLGFLIATFPGNSIATYIQQRIISN